MVLWKELDLDRPFEDLRHETMLNIVHTANLFTIVGQPLFRRFDLTEAQFNLLFALKFKTRELTQSELGKRLVVTRASVTSLIESCTEDAPLTTVMTIVPGPRLSGIAVGDGVPSVLP